MICEHLCQLSFVNNSPPGTVPSLSSDVIDYVRWANASNMMNPLTGTVFNFGTHLVPEPTSGLLMMLGAGLLALRRRRRA